MGMSKLLVECSNCNKTFELIEMIETYNFGWLCDSCFDALEQPDQLSDTLITKQKTKQKKG